MNTPTLARRIGTDTWLRVVRVCVLGLVLASVALGSPAPGLSGRRLVLLAGIVMGALAWLLWEPAVRADRRVALPFLAAGMVGACLAGLVSPDTSALVLSAVLAIMAGSTLGFLEGAGVAACGLVTLAAGSLVITSRDFSLLDATLVVAGGLLAGLWRGQFRLRAEQAELVAAQARRAEQEHVRAQVLDERARIAREIHDILAHTLGGLVVQLDAADALLSDGHDPDGGRRLVGGARHLAVEGLEETRRAIVALRTDPVDLPEALGALTVGDGRRGQVSYEVRGAPRRLAPEASLAVYRTTQEALANARKHAPGAPVAVTLSFREQVTGLRIANGAPPDVPAGGDRSAVPLAASGGGYGLDGLAERAELLGGTLHAGPDGDGWAVELEVPA